MGLQRFNTFCAHHNVTPLPATKVTVTYFAVSLSRHLLPSTIRIYISAIRAAHRESNFPDPTHQNNQLKLVLEGIRRQHVPKSTRRHKPITSRLLSRMVEFLSQGKGLPHHDRQMLLAAFTLAFHGFLCMGKFTKPQHTTFNQRFHTSTSRVHLHCRYYTYFPHLKTDQLHYGHTICIPTASTLVRPPRQPTREQVRPPSSISADGGVMHSKPTSIPTLHSTERSGQLAQVTHYHDRCCYHPITPHITFMLFPNCQQSPCCHAACTHIVHGSVGLFGGFHHGNRLTDHYSIDTCDNTSIHKVVNKVWGNQTQPSLVSVRGGKNSLPYHLSDGKKSGRKSGLLRDSKPRLSALYADALPTEPKSPASRQSQ